MAAKTSLSLIIVFILSVLLLYSGLGLATKDPELEQCQHQCRVQQQFGKKDKEDCERKCEDYHREKKGRECEEYLSVVNPRNSLRECQRPCERLGGEARQLCLLRCREKWRSEQKSWGEEDEREKGEGEGQEKHNPYVFGDQHFSTKVKTEHGRVDLLTKFTKKSELLRGIENYRLALLVANPNSFVVPNHFDADAIFVVTQGSGTIKLIHEDERKSFDIERGDIIRVRAGTPIYLINRDNNEKLFIVKFLQPVNIPGHYDVFYGAAGEDPQSVYRTFSTEILEAALRTSRDKLESFFGKQDQGPFLKASKEQIQALSSHEKGGFWPFGGDDSKGAFNLFRKRRPSQSNKYGQLFEVDADEFKPLKGLDLRISYANITKGAMSAIYYNSRATKIAIVVKGEGYLEMACPQRRKSGPSYNKCSSRLRTDIVFIVPAGRPFVTVASRNNNLEILCFEVNAKGNVRYPLAGKGNIVKQFEKEAKELAFKAKEEEVDNIFDNQEEEFFFPGPRQPGGRAYE